MILPGLPYSASAKKLLQKFRAFAGQNTAANLDLMIQGRVVQDMHCRMHSPGLGVLGAIYQAPDARVHYGSSAHSAGLNGHEQIATRQAMISNGGPGLAQSHDLGMSGWVGV